MLDNNKFVFCSMASTRTNVLCDNVYWQWNITTLVSFYTFVIFVFASLRHRRRNTGHQFTLVTPTTLLR